MGGDKKPSARYFERGGHGKTVIAETTLTDTRCDASSRRTIDDLLELAFVGTQGAIASGMQSVRLHAGTAIAAIFTATGQDIGMVGTSSMAHGTAHRVEGGLNVALRLPALEVATVGGGTTLPYAPFVAAAVGLRRPRASLSPGPDRGRPDPLLEISASAAMATAGSENFYRAHFERGGLR